MLTKAPDFGSYFHAMELQADGGAARYGLLGKREPRMPEQGQSIFAAPDRDTPRSDSVCLGWLQGKGKTKFIGRSLDDNMSDAYWDAADLLVASFLQRTNDCGTDQIFYPIMQLYRHAVELSLKSTLKAARKAGLLSGSRSFNGHELKVLWARVKAVAENLPDAGSSCEYLTAANVLINELDMADPNGFRFRYATDTNEVLMERAFPDRVNVRKLREIMWGLRGYLDSLQTAIMERHRYT
jgi:hypothetical protein